MPTSQELALPSVYFSLNITNPKYINYNGSTTTSNFFMNLLLKDSHTMKLLIPLMLCNAHISRIGLAFFVLFFQHNITMVGLEMVVMDVKKG